MSEGLVVTLETARKLKAAEFPQLTYWRYEGDGNLIGLHADTWYSEDAPAPTAQEVADQLPQSQPMGVGQFGVVLQLARHGTGWRAGYLNENSATAGTMAEALAALWLKLQGAV